MTMNIIIVSWHRHCRRQIRVTTASLLAIIAINCFRESIRIVGVDALPREHNKKDAAATSSNSLMKLSQRQNARGRGISSRSVTLHDSFPCESVTDRWHREENSGQQGTTLSSVDTSDHFERTISSQPTVETTSKSSSNDTCSEIKALDMRGGEAQLAYPITNHSFLCDEVLDQLVEDLINSADTKEASSDDMTKEIIQSSGASMCGQDENCDTIYPVDTSTFFQWIHSLILSIFRSIVSFLRKKIQRLSSIKLQKCDSGVLGINNVPFKHSQRLTSRAASWSSQKHRHQGAFEKDAFSSGQRRFTFQISTNINANAPAPSLAHRKTRVNKQAASNIDVAITPLPRYEKNFPKQRKIDITQLQSQLKQRRSSSILISAEKSNTKAPPMQLLNAVKKRQDRNAE